MTWLRHHKSSQFEASLQATADSYKDEPSWIVEQLLRRKREELVGRWEDREKRLEALRLKEKALEERGRKRRRIEESHVTGARIIDEDAEWLLDDLDDRDAGPQDALSGLSKESRDVLMRMGLGGPKKQDEDDDLLEEEIKVRSSVPIGRDLPDSNTSRFITLQEPIPNFRSSSPNFVGLLSRRRCRSPLPKMNDLLQRL